MAKPDKIDVDNTFEIYCLYCPITGEPRYIGKSINSKRRFSQHIFNAKTGRTPVYCWIRKLLNSGSKPIMKVIEKTKDWAEAEKRLIKEYRSKYKNLLNIADGGDEPFCPKEVRAENGRKNAYKIHHSDECVKKIWYYKKILGESLKKGYLREDTKQRLFNIARKNPKLFGGFLKYENK